MALFSIANDFCVGNILKININTLIENIHIV